MEIHKLFIGCTSLITTKISRLHPSICDPWRLLSQINHRSFGSTSSMSAEMKLVISKGVISSQDHTNVLQKCQCQQSLSIFIESIVGIGAWEFLRAMVLQVVDTQNQLVINLWSDTNQK